MGLFEREGATLARKALGQLLYPLPPSQSWHFFRMAKMVRRRSGSCEPTGGGWSRALCASRRTSRAGPACGCRRSRRALLPGTGIAPAAHGPPVLLILLPNRPRGCAVGFGCEAGMASPRQGPPRQLVPCTYGRTDSDRWHARISCNPTASGGVLWMNGYRFLKNAARWSPCISARGGYRGCSPSLHPRGPGPSGQTG